MVWNPHVHGWTYMAPLPTNTWPLPTTIVPSGVWAHAAPPAQAWELISADGAIFNLVAFFELVAVNFGAAAHRWLEEQRALIRTEGKDWQSALVLQSDKLQDLLKGWDTNGDGKISKKEFRRGVAALGVGAPSNEVCATRRACQRPGSSRA